MSRTTRARLGGPHELGQNDLVDRSVVAAIVDAVGSDGPVIELGAGRGTLTAALAATGRPVTAVELDPRRAGALARRLPRVEVWRNDLLDVRVGARDVVSNVPFAITTPLLRHLLPQPGWPTAVLLLQWEVARKRAAVGGATMMTAQWWPWYGFALLRRVPAGAFRPVPSVDGGLLAIGRRARPLVGDRRSYPRLVREVFAAGSPGAALRGRLSARAARRHGIDLRASPRNLTREKWLQLHDLV